MYSSRMCTIHTSTIRGVSVTEMSPWTETPRTETPPSCGLTNISENITFPQLHLRVVINRLWDSFLKPWNSELGDIDTTDT